MSTRALSVCSIRMTHIRTQPIYIPIHTANEHTIHTHTASTHTAHIYIYAHTAHIYTHKAHIYIHTQHIYTHIHSLYTAHMHTQPMHTEKHKHTTCTNTACNTAFKHAQRAYTKITVLKVKYFYLSGQLLTKHAQIAYTTIIHSLNIYSLIPSTVQANVGPLPAVRTALFSVFFFFEFARCEAARSSRRQLCSLHTNIGCLYTNICTLYSNLCSVHTNICSLPYSQIYVPFWPLYSNLCSVNYVL